MSKDQLNIPLIFAATGAAAGVAVAMLFRYDQQNDRVYIDDSAPLVAVGFVCGHIFGRCIKRASQTSPRLRWLIEVVATTLLIGSVGAVLGWLGGDKRWVNPPPSMLWGLFAGAVGGVLVGGGHVICDRRRLQRRMGRNGGVEETSWPV
jgi:hypothetical protein